MNEIQADLERLGIFKEMSYHTIRDPYDKPNSRIVRSAYKGRQMYCSGSKQRSATADGYFSPFTRIFSGDNKIDIERLMRMQRKESAKKNKGKPWIPSNGSHKLLGFGSSLDTFSGPTPYFKSTVKTKHEKLDHRRNFYTSPAKKGCGSYIDITIGKFPAYKSDPYDKRSKQDTGQSRLTGKHFYLNLHPEDYFDRNPFRHVAVKRGPPDKTQSPSSYRKNVFKPSSGPKSIGGCKDGCFSPFPKYTPNRPRKYEKTKSSKPPLKIPSCPKSYPISSILEVNIKRRINSSNYKEMKTSIFNV
ncbi:unnamed protein product [Heterobilharzia americana]|nr:unnamed protein product [Heterobilharzia americana]